MTVRGGSDTATTTAAASAPERREPRRGPAGSEIVVRAPGGAEVDFRGHLRRRRLRNWALGLSVPVLVLVAWQVCADQGWIDSRFYGSPSAAWSEGVGLVTDGTMAENLWITVQRLVLGYAIGSVAGVLVGLLLGQSQLLRATFEPMLRALYVIPKLAILPILLLVFGLGEMPKLAFIALGVFFIVVFSTLSAATMIPTAYHEVASSYGLRRFQAFRWIVLPGSMPQIVAALRLASGIAVLLVVAVEFVNANDGIGFVTWHAWELFRADRMYAGIVTISVLGVVFSALVSLLGRLLAPWAENEG
ncbi:MAG: ABC transporter permease [Actinomycetota bacterium]|nr:ABC transporter permease [Actinomycetota bacterium]